MSLAAQLVGDIVKSASIPNNSTPGDQQAATSPNSGKRKRFSLTIKQFTSHEKGWITQMQLSYWHPES
jgi:hypothetical protein